MTFRCSFPHANPQALPTGRQNRVPAALTDGSVSDKSAPGKPNRPPGGAGKRVRTSFHSLNRGSLRSGNGSCAIKRNWETKDCATEVDDFRLANIKSNIQKATPRTTIISPIEPVGKVRARKLRKPSDAT